VSVATTNSHMSAQTTQRFNNCFKDLWISLEIRSIPK